MSTILITGGTGFLGRFLSRKLSGEHEVILCGRNHGNNEFARQQTGCTVAPLDITHAAAVREIFAQYRPQVVIHAAASKSVNVAEAFPNECIDANVRGSQNVAQAAAAQGVEYVMGISTDKAAQPCTGVYGLSKALMEKLFLALNNSGHTRYCCLRFGNIAWSTGSVFPLWKTMAETNGHIQTTGAHMRRFIFSVHDAVEMIHAVFENRQELAGTIVMPEMKAVQMEDMLISFARQYGGTTEKIAPRPGESEDEIMVAAHEAIHTRRMQLNNRPYFIYNPAQKGEGINGEGIHTANTPRLSEAEIQALIYPPVTG